MRRATTVLGAWMGCGLILIGTHTAAEAQNVERTRAGPRAVLDAVYEVDLARSAAPAAVSADATILRWTGSGFEVADEGTNGVTCYVARSWPDSLEPHCFDQEGARTILPIHLKQMELWHQGKSAEEVEAAVADGLRSGEFQLPRRPAMSYMMSAKQELISDSGTRAGAWESHLMIYYPYLTAADLGLGPVPSTEAAMVEDAGTPLSNITIVLREFARESEPTGGSSDPS